MVRALWLSLHLVGFFAFFSLLLLGSTTAERKKRWVLEGCIFRSLLFFFFFLGKKGVLSVLCLLVRIYDCILYPLGNHYYIYKYSKKLEKTASQLLVSDYYVTQYCHGYDKCSAMLP